jgi:hypothetical protein
VPTKQKGARIGRPGRMSPALGQHVEHV